MYRSNSNSNGIWNSEGYYPSGIESITGEEDGENDDEEEDGDRLTLTAPQIDLMSEISHELYFKKDNFKTKITSINPEKKGGKKKFIEFGIVKDLGYYYELNPKRLVVELEWESLPSTKGIVPFKIMGELISEVDNMKKNSNLTSEEYDIAISQILRFFEWIWVLNGI